MKKLKYSLHKIPPVVEQGGSVEIASRAVGKSMKNNFMNGLPFIIPGQQRPVVHTPFDFAGRKAAKSYDKKAQFTNDIIAGAIGTALTTLTLGVVKGAVIAGSNAIKLGVARHQVKKAEKVMTAIMNETATEPPKEAEEAEEKKEVENTETKTINAGDI